MKLNLARLVYTDKGRIPAVGVIGPNEVAQMPNKELPASAVSSTHSSSSGSGSRSNAEGGGLPPEAEPPASDACGAPDYTQSVRI